MLAALGHQPEGWNELRRIQQENQLAALNAQLAAAQQQLQHQADERARWQQNYLYSSMTYFAGSTVGLLSRAGMIGTGVIPSMVETDEQRAARLEREAAYREQAMQTERQRQQATQRALGLLKDKVGSVALAKIQAGGAYRIHSKRWPSVDYLVPKDPHERVKVVDAGSLVTEVCIVSTEYSLPWPDIMLQRITAIEMDETILFETGNVSPKKPSRLRQFFRTTLNLP